MAEEQRKLVKSRTNRVIDGVCGGIGEYFDIDPVIVRIVFVILSIWGGAGVLLYIVAMLIIPEEGKESILKSKNKGDFKEKIESVADEIKDTVTSEKHTNRAELFLGLALLLIGFVLLFNTFFPWLTFAKLWPLILIIIGVTVMLSGSKKG